MTERQDITLALTDDMVDELKGGWEQIRKGGMKHLPFEKYLTACVMAGHSEMHKVLGALVIMQQESNRLGRKKE